jgi:hypothetical protein
MHNQRDSEAAMRGILFGIATLMIPAAGFVYFASYYRSRENWASQVCSGVHGLCDQPWWLAAIVAAALCVILGLKATKT